MIRRGRTIMVVSALLFGTAPAMGAVGTFHVENLPYETVTVDTEHSTLTYNYPDGGGSTPLAFRPIRFGLIFGTTRRVIAFL